MNLLGFGVAPMERIAPDWCSMKLRPTWPELFASPFGCFESAELRDLRIGAIATVQEQCVSRAPGPVITLTDMQGGRLYAFFWGQPFLVIAAEHVENEDIVKAVAINIRNIYCADDRRFVKAIPIEPASGLTKPVSVDFGKRSRHI